MHNNDLQKRLKNLANRKLVKTFNHPALSVVCDSITPEDDLKFLDKMKRACNAFRSGVGLAAPQIGITKRAIFINNPGTHPYYMINPVIISKSEETELAIEGCLSYPNVHGEIERPKVIVVTYCGLNDFGDYLDTGKLFSFEPITQTFHDFEARIICHEIDHLDGICKVKDFWLKKQ